MIKKSARVGLAWLGAMSLLGCAPCAGEFIDADGSCGTGCPGIVVGEVRVDASGCRAEPLLWCIPRVQRVDDGDTTYITDIETGNVYTVSPSYYPEFESLPPHLRRTTSEERAALCRLP